MIVAPGRPKGTSSSFGRLLVSANAWNSSDSAGAALDGPFFQSALKEPDPLIVAPLSLRVL